MSALPSAPTSDDRLALLRFGPLEGRVMQALWAIEEATLADLHHVLGESEISLSALRTALEKLHLKRLVRRRTVHRTAYFRAMLDQSTFIQLLRQQLADFLGDEGLALLRET